MEYNGYPDDLVKSYKAISRQESSLWKKKKSSSSWTMRISTELPGRKDIVWTITTCSSMWVRSDFSSMRIATSQSIRGTNIGWTEKYRNYGVLDILLRPRWALSPVEHTNAISMLKSPWTS